MACKSAKGSKKEDASLTLDAITALFQQHGEDLKSEFKSSVNMLSSKLDQVRQAQEEQAERKNLASFEELSTKYGLPTSHFFRYLQTRNFIQSHLSGSASPPEHTLLETILSGEGLPLPASKRRALAFCSLIARRTVLTRWKGSAPPTHKQWLCDLMSCLKLERIRCSLQHATGIGM
ncbi:unnamed protein product [Menidia menidia]|uniref:(Atlantic silverside) hypothetical protein n=1 Tax=Menidia menidia TaxID=238744 RepID=A0A8S4AJN6_9TELE|nr:unnamed protein product [Menidia menidia]